MGYGVSTPWHESKRIMYPHTPTRTTDRTVRYMDADEEIALKWFVNIAGPVTEPFAKFADDETRAQNDPSEE